MKGPKIKKNPPEEDYFCGIFKKKSDEYRFQKNGK
jgi:hypothetical protein